MNIQERIEALETEFAEKIKTLKAEAQQRDEFPKDGDIYWLINTAGETNWVHWHDTEIDNKRLSFGNAFKTKEQAEFAAEKLRVEAELRKFSRPFDYERFNHFIKIHQDGTIEIHFDKSFQNQGTIYFESGEKAAEAIKSVGAERIKKYIFRVED